LTDSSRGPMSQPRIPALPVALVRWILGEDATVRLNLTAPLTPSRSSVG